MPTKLPINTKSEESLGIRTSKSKSTGNTSIAVVVGLDEFIGIQTARSLAARGVTVIGIAEDTKHFCARTRAVESVIECEIEAPVLVDTLMSLGADLDEKAVLFPCLDTAVEIISHNQEGLSRYFHLAISDRDTVEKLMDKERFYRFALDERLRVPKTFLLYHKSDAEYAADRLAFPCVLKPAFRRPEWNANVRQKVVMISSREEFIETYDRCAPWAETLIAQELVPGPESNLYQCNCYYSSTSKLLCSFTTRKVRQWPPDTGLGSLSEACHDETVLELTRDIFSRVRYRGFGYAEIKKSSSTGEYFIIEANIGRTTGMSALAEYCGIEMTYTWYCDKVGLPLPDNQLLPRFERAKWIYLAWDVRASWYRWRRGELTVRDWIKSLRGPKYYAIFSFSDPVPFLAFLGSKLRSVFTTARS